MNDIILRPLLKNSWSGIIKYKNCYEDIAPYFTRSGRIYTGLTEGDATRIGNILGIDLNPSSSYWKDFFIRTFGKDLYLRPDVDINDELKYLFLKNHKRVKSSIMENKATANFVLINKEEEAKRANKSNEAKIEAMTGFAKMSPDEMRKCLRLFGKNANSMSDQLVKNRLFEIVEGDPNSFLTRWVDNSKRETEYLLESAIAANIVRKNSNLYKFGSDTIGHTLDETLDFLDDRKNQDIRISIAKQIEGKKFIVDTTDSFDTGVADLAKDSKIEELPEEDKKIIKASPKKKKVVKDTI